jgi:hypothetical protein
MAPGTIYKHPRLPDRNEVLARQRAQREGRLPLRVQLLPRRSPSTATSTRA